MVFSRYCKLALFSLLVLNIISANSSAQTPIRILALGDSLTAGLGLAPEQGFTAQLQQALREQGHQVEIINAGVSGDTTTGGLARLDWALADQPDAVILALGANDGLRAIDPKLTERNLHAIMEKLQSNSLPVLLVGMLAPPNLGPEYEEAFNSIYSKLATQFESEFYPFFLQDVALVPEYNQNDGIHPNVEGVAIIVRNMLPYAERFLAQIQAQ